MANSMNKAWEEALLTTPQVKRRYSAFLRSQGLVTLADEIDPAKQAEDRTTKEFLKQLLEYQ